MISRWGCVGALIAVLIGWSAVPASTLAAGPGCDPAHAREVARRIQTRYEAIRDLQADFEQTTHATILSGALLGDETVRRGKVVFAKPGRMRWAYEEPEPSLVVSDGQLLWIYDPAAREASRMPVDGGYLAGAALQFLLGEGELLDTFEIESLDCTVKGASLELVPREPASYERLGLVADERTGEVRQTSIVDLFGNRTRIRFEKIRTNVDPPAETFRFEPPPGVRVVDLGRDRPSAKRRGSSAGIAHEGPDAAMHPRATDAHE